MSGVAAMLSLDGAPADAGELSPILAVLEHRGPDGTAVRSVGPAVLGAARLDTLPEDGPQPVVCGELCLVADARLDNRKELLRRLRAAEDASDAFLIAEAVHRWSAGALEHLEGDFAFVAWTGNVLLAARDRFGVRPLFYAQTAGRVVLASEIRAIAAHPRLSARTCRAYFLEQLAAGVPPTRLTPSEGIWRLLPGELLEARPGRSWQTRRYYSLPTGQRSMTLEDAADATRALLDEAVRQCLRVRGSVACDVSGGMDSTSIYASARALGANPHAMSVVSERWPTLDERDYSRELVGDKPWTQVLAEDLPPFSNALRAARQFDEPMQDVIFETRLAMNRVLPEGCRVVLGGHGGDALMTGGFDALRTLLLRGRFVSAYLEARSWADLRDLPLTYSLARALFPHVLSAKGLPWASERVAREATAAARRVSRTYAREGHGSFDRVSFLASTETGLRQQPSAPVELRFPFLYRPLVEHALSTPPLLKAKAGLGKRVLRHAMRGRLPRRILERVLKTGYASAYTFGLLANWPRIEDWLREPWLADLGILDAAGFRRLVSAFRDGHAEHEMKVIYALVDEAWLRVMHPRASQELAYDSEWLAWVGRR